MSFQSETLGYTKSGTFVDKNYLAKQTLLFSDNPLDCLEVMEPDYSSWIIISGTGTIF